MGDVYYKYWAVPNVPKAIINRRGGVLSKDTWAGRIYDEFAQTTSIGIDLKCQYEATTHQVEIETDLKTLAEDVKGKLQLWLVEDKYRCSTDVYQTIKWRKNMYIITCSVLLLMGTGGRN